MKRFFICLAALILLGGIAYGIKLYVRYTWPKSVPWMQDLPPVDRSSWTKTPAPWMKKVVVVDVATPMGLQRRTFSNSVNSVGMELVRIEPGTFRMGATEALHKLRREATAYGHDVTLTRPYYLGALEVCNREFELFDPAHLGKRPGYQRGHAGDEHPVEGITWREAQLFCRWLSAREGRLYRLPTEAEWEYACRAGTDTRTYWGDEFWDRNKANTKGYKSIEESWADDGYKFTAPIGSYPANPWGLFDMIGNAREWVNDWYGPYATKAEVDPQGPPNVGHYRVMKGAGWMTPSRHLNCSNRDGNNPADLHDPNGFRVLCETP